MRKIQQNKKENNERNIQTKTMKILKILKSTNCFIFFFGLTVSNHLTILIYE